MVTTEFGAQGTLDQRLLDRHAVLIASPLIGSVTDRSMRCLGIDGNAADLAAMEAQASDHAVSPRTGERTPVQSADGSRCSRRIACARRITGLSIIFPSSATAAPWLVAAIAITRLAHASSATFGLKLAFTAPTCFG